MINNIKKNIALTTEDVNKEEKSRVFVISTADEDLDGDVILSEGVDSSVFDKHPKIYLDHNIWSQPIARSAWVNKTPTLVKSKAMFNEKSELSMQIFDSVDEFYDSASINADILTAEDVELRTCSRIKGSMGEYRARLVKRCQLIEWSIMQSIAANPNTRIEKARLALQKGYTEIAKQIESTVAISDLLDVIKAQRIEIEELIKKNDDRVAKLNESVINLIKEKRQFKEAEERVSDTTAISLAELRKLIGGVVRDEVNGFVNSKKE